MKNKYVKVNDIMELINTSNRGTCDYFIVDQIEKLCKSEKVYNVDKVVDQLESELRLADKEKERCARENPLQFDSAKGYAMGLSNAIEIVKAGGK